MAHSAHPLSRAWGVGGGHWPPLWGCVNLFCNVAKFTPHVVGVASLRMRTRGLSRVGVVWRLREMLGAEVGRVVMCVVERMW